VVIFRSPKGIREQKKFRKHSYKSLMYLRRVLCITTDRG